MRKWHWLLIALISVYSNQLFANQVIYHGRFEQVTVTSGDETCANLFEPREFTVRHFLLGPSGLTSVLYFQNDQRGGWLEGRRFVGRYDYREIYAEETVEGGDWVYDIVSRGIVNSEVLLVDFDVVAYDNARETERCRVTGEFSAFSR